MRTFLDLCKTVTAQQLAAVGVFAESARVALANDPPEGSYVAQVTDYVHAIADSPEREAALFVLLETGNAVTKATWNVRDHANAFRAAINDESRPTTSLMTLVRAMLEGTLTVAHLLEPVGPELTLARGMAHWLDTAEGTLRTLRHVPDGIGPGTKAIEATIDTAYEYFGARGFETQQTTRRPRETIRVSFGAAKVGLPIKITALAARFLEHQPDLYPVLSGPAHSKNWFLSATFQIGDEPGEFATYEQSWGAAVIAALDVSDLLVSSVGRALDLDVEDLLKRSHFRRRALIASVSGSPFSPMSHEDFRVSKPGRSPGSGAAFGFARTRRAP